MQHALGDAHAPAAETARIAAIQDGAGNRFVLAGSGRPIIGAQGSVDRSYRAAARTELTIGGRRFAARVLGATAAGDDLTFTLGFATAPGA